MASTDAVVSLSGKTAVQDGATVDFTTAKSIVSMVVVVTGTVSSGVVIMQSSHDGTNWVDHSYHSVDRGVNFHSEGIGGAFRYWRASIRAAVVGGGSVSATFMEAG